MSILKSIFIAGLAVVGLCFGGFIIALLLDYREGKKGCVGKITFERFMHLYTIAPDRWKLMSSWVTYDKFGRKSPSRMYRDMPSESHYYFSIPDTVRYILWVYQQEKDAYTLKTNKIIESDIQFWQEDIRRYCEEHNIPVNKEENSS